MKTTAVVPVLPSRTVTSLMASRGDPVEGIRPEMLSGAMLLMVWDTVKVSRSATGWQPTLMERPPPSPTPGEP